MMKILGGPLSSDPVTNSVCGQLFSERVDAYVYLDVSVCVFACICVCVFIDSLYIPRRNDDYSS